MRLRWKRSAQDAMDLTQQFFERLIEGTPLTAANRERGRFRAFLKTCLDNHVRNEVRRDHAKIRGGGRPSISLEFGEDPDCFLVGGSEDSPEEILDRHWRRATMDEALKKIEELYRTEGKEVYFQVFRAYDLASSPEGRPTQEALAKQLGIARADVDHYLRHARKRMLEIIRQLLSTSVRGPKELEREIQDFYAQPLF
jgi:RNA polymerase sigma-70 factor (ECF subfamily)